VADSGLGDFVWGPDGRLAVKFRIYAKLGATLAKLFRFWGFAPVLRFAGLRPLFPPVDPSLYPAGSSSPPLPFKIRDPPLLAKNIPFVFFVFVLPGVYWHVTSRNGVHCSKH